MRRHCRRHRDGGRVRDRSGRAGACRRRQAPPDRRAHPGRHRVEQHLPRSCPALRGPAHSTSCTIGTRSGRQHSRSRPSPRARPLPRPSGRLRRTPIGQRRHRRVRPRRRRRTGRTRPRRPSRPPIRWRRSSIRSPCRNTVRRGAACALPLSGTTGSATRVITVMARSTSATVATPAGVAQGAGRRLAEAWARPSRRTRRRRHVAQPERVPLGDPDRQLHAHPGLRPLRQSRHRRCRTSRPPRPTGGSASPGRCTTPTSAARPAARSTRATRTSTSYYETPYYNYAVVIDYNTRNAPGGVRQGAGSAFFLHVTDGTTDRRLRRDPAGRLMPIMRWLTPSRHPRILIGRLTERDRVDGVRRAR